VPPEHAAANEPRRLLRAARSALADHEHSAARTEAVEAFYRLAHDWLVVTEVGEELEELEELEESEELDELPEVVELPLELVPALEFDEVVVA
jgi:hypothetical protein